MTVRLGRVPRAVALDRVSIELTRACNKGCWFCYNGSSPGGETRWSAGEVVDFARDLAANGVAAVSFGGGEPLQYPGVFEILARLDGALFRSVTTNGLLLDAALDALVDARPDKVHVSIHFPERAREVDRVIRQVLELEARAITSGVNLLVRRSGLAAATRASRALADAGIGLERIVFLPMRGDDTPAPADLAGVAGAARFQSMTCLVGCAASPRFASVDWDRKVAWCSYTTARRPMESADYRGLVRALDGLELVTC